MRLNRYSVLSIVAVFVILAGFSYASANDYERRFTRNFPPGYNGMWYYAERFRHADDRQDKTQEKYRWDRFMSRVTGMTYPFLPVPYAWDYGTTEKFNLPEYNTNDWP
jgi:hypothetical protein